MDVPARCDETGLTLYAHVEHRSYPAWLDTDEPTVAQRSAERWAELIERPALARAVMLEDTPFEDHLCYAEWRPTRMPTAGWRHPFGWIRPPIEDHGLRRYAGRLLGQMRLWTEDPALSDEQLRSTLVERLKPLEGRLDDGFIDELLPIARAAIRPAASKETWDHGDAQFNLFGQVTEQSEARVMAWLRANNATRERHWADSGSMASKGERWRATFGETHVHYVPHSWIDDEWRQEVTHEVRLPGFTPTVADAVLVAVGERYTKYVEAFEDLLECECGEKRWIERKRQCGKKRWERFSAAAESGEPIEHRSGECRFRAVNADILAEHSGRLFGDGWLTKGMSERLGEYETSIEELRGTWWSWRWCDGFDDAPLDGKSRAGFRAAIARDVDDRFSHPSSVKRILERYVSWNHLLHETREGERLVSVVHDATRSERGLLRIENAPVADAVELLQAAGLVGDWVEQIPESVSGFGRVLPRHPVYRDRPVSLPAERLLVHGLTGAHNRDSALERMRSMIDAGGIKSIYERRRMRVWAGQTLSPDGDVGSGIDEGVPTVLGDPVFGDWVFFVLKPDVLARRDLWFAPHDYGGSSGRYDLYNRYARSIGQGKLHWPASDTARIQHYRTGLGASNEAYLRYEVPWSDVAAVVARQDIIDEVTTMLMNDPTIPEGIEIFAGGNGGRGRKNRVRRAVRRARERYADQYRELPDEIERDVHYSHGLDEAEEVSVDPSARMPKGVYEILI